MEEARAFQGGSDAPLTLRWGAFSVLTPFAIFAGGFLQDFRLRLGVPELVAASAVGTALGVLALMLLWAPRDGVVRPSWSAGFKWVPGGLWTGWAVVVGLFSLVWCGHAIALVLYYHVPSVPYPLSPAVPVLLAALIIGPVLWWQRRHPRVLIGVAVLTAAAWLAILPHLLAVPTGLSVPNPVPAHAAHIYLIRMLNVAGLAAATVLLSAPLAGAWPRPAPGRPWTLVGRAAAVGALFLALMYVGMHVGTPGTGMVAFLPHHLWPAGLIALLGGVVLWASAAVYGVSKAFGSSQTPAWVWAALAVPAVGLASWLSASYPGATAPLSADEIHALALGYLVAPWLGVLLAQRLLRRGQAPARGRTLAPWWSVAAWAGGLVLSVPASTGFGGIMSVGAGPVVLSLLPGWRWRGFLRPQLDWTLPVGVAAAFAIYAAAWLVHKRQSAAPAQHVL